MKQIFTVLICILLAPNVMEGQELIFCEKINASGNPLNAATVFNLSQNGEAVTIYMKIPPGVVVSSVSFDVYRLAEGKEVFVSSMKQQVTSRGYVSKQFTFYDEGRYVIYAFDEKDKELTMGKVTIRKVQNQE